jgi:hypothetical protein
MNRRSDAFRSLDSRFLSPRKVVATPKNVQTGYALAEVRPEVLQVAGQVTGASFDRRR